LPLHVTEIAQPAQKSAEQVAVHGGFARALIEESDSPDFFLLRERNRRAEQSDSRENANHATAMQFSPPYGVQRLYTRAKSGPDPRTSRTDSPDWITASVCWMLGLEIEDDPRRARSPTADDSETARQSVLSGADVVVTAERHRPRRRRSPRRQDGRSR